jgi:mannose-6-phosphate isomerase-like protein (cupin superfamily)
MPPAGRQSALRFDLDATTRNATMDYNIKTDVKFGPLESFDAGQMSREGKDKWWNQSLCQVNDCVVRLGVFEGEFHWHKHDAEDEVFFVMEGHLSSTSRGGPSSSGRIRASRFPEVCFTGLAPLRGPSC